MVTPSADGGAATNAVDRTYTTNTAPAADERRVTLDDLFAQMELCWQSRNTSWVWEWHLIDLHNAIHRFYDDDSDSEWFPRGTAEVHDVIEPSPTDGSEAA